MYILAAIAGSTASFMFGPQAQSVGASGAVFGLFGVVLVASRVHHPVLDRRSRAISAQVGTLIIINLAFGFGLGGGSIDNAAHVGGLVAGMWMGLILLPPGTPTLGRMWQLPGGGTAGVAPGPVLQALGLAALVLVLAVALILGTQAYHRNVGLAEPAAIAERGAVLAR